jgi:hypothetical protein
MSNKRQRTPGRCQPFLRLRRTSRRPPKVARESSSAPLLSAETISRLRRSNESCKAGGCGFSPSPSKGTVFLIRGGLGAACAARVRGSQDPQGAGVESANRAPRHKIALSCVLISLLVWPPCPGGCSGKPEQSDRHEAPLLFNGRARLPLLWANRANVRPSYHPFVTTALRLCKDLKKMRNLPESPRGGAPL